MANKTGTTVTDTTAAVVEHKDEGVKLEPTVRICLPPKEDQNSNMAIDQNETVTINGVNTVIRRGQYVDVKVPVFIQLKQRFPTI